MIRRRLPPEDLVIYEVRGEWDEAERGELGSGFLGFWIEGGYTFLFFSALADGEVERLLAAARGLELRYVHRMKYSQWQDGAGFAAFSVGPLAIVPAWEEVPDKPGRRVVRIDPGLAFGFGGHPTTRACLEALVRIYSRERPARVLDLGAGTGVLALAAARLGATQALAVEYSHLAAETATGNVELNGLQDVVRVIRGRAEDHLDFQAELVMANLHFRVQEAVLDRGGYRDRTWLVLSGLFHEQAQTLEPRLTGTGYRVVDRVRDERWATLLLRAAD